MTPRRLAGFLWFAQMRKRREAALALEIATLAARGDGKEITERLRRWNRQ